MFIYGELINTNGQLIRVEILTNGDRTEQIGIGAEDSGISFDADSVHVDCEVNDTLDHTIRHSALIRLQTDRYIPELYCSNCMDATVRIYRDGVCLFSGFVEPQTYNQDFNSVADILEINCIDALSALQYFKFANIGTAGVDYNTEKSKAEMRTFAELLEGCISTVSDGDMFYDGSVTLPDYPEGVYSPHLFLGVSISELLFFGDDEDDTWTLLEIVDEIMRYLNLHMIQLGDEFYIFSWKTVKDGGAVTWTSFADGTITTAVPETVTFTDKNVSDTGTTITIGEVFSRIELTASVTSVDSLVTSPLDSDSIYSPFTGRQLYVSVCGEKGGDSTSTPGHMRVLVNTGKYTGKYSGFKSFILQQWYIQVKDNLQWKFHANGVGEEGLIATFAQTNTNQQVIPNWLRLNGGAGLLSMGKAEIISSTAVTDSSLINSIDMSDYLVVTVNGNEDDTESNHSPTQSSRLRSCPRAEYVGRVSGNVFSPTDEDTTNYIVISGNIILNPIMHGSMDSAFMMDETGVRANLGTGKYEKWKGEDYYTCYRWMKCDTPASAPEDHFAVNGGVGGLVPFLDLDVTSYEYQRTRNGLSDYLSQVPVLACMLVIGDKCVTQYMEEDSRGVPVYRYEWVAYKEREECESDAEYYSQYFTIGFDPKVGDKLIGTSFDIQNNIDYTMDIDASGTAIPIKMSDRLSGTVQFKILGPVAMLWKDNEVLTSDQWFAHPDWESGSIPLMSHVSSIFIKDFEIKVYSDNGHITVDSDDDLVYASDTDEDFVNVKDDLEFRFTSSLTPEERIALAYPSTVDLSTPMAVDSGLLEIQAGDDVGKPEKLYVDAVYSEYHIPRVLLEQSVVDVSENVSFIYHYLHPALDDKEFYVVGISRDLGDGTARLNLKEIDHD